MSSVNEVRLEQVAQLVRLPLSSILPYPQNPRLHGPAVAAVKASIEQYGYNVPIVVDANHVIITGHARRQALEELGVDAVEVVVSPLSEEAARAYRIADNKTSELAVWDAGMLVAELRSVQDLGGMQVFFGAQSLEALLTTRVESPTEEGERDTAYKAPEQSRIEARAEELDSRFNRASEAYVDDLMDFDCPHCQETFALSANELERRVQLTEKTASDRAVSAAWQERKKKRLLTAAEERVAATKGEAS